MDREVPSPSATVRGWDEQLRARERAARIRRLAAVTVVLWLATLIVALAHV